MRRILVANRGEIACRIIRAAQALGIETVAVYSKADAGALHCQMADVVVSIGPAPAAQSYLNTEAVLAAGLRLPLREHCLCPGRRGRRHALNRA